MNKISSLHNLGIEWKGSPRFWKMLPRNLLPTCDIFSNVFDVSGNKKFNLVPKGNLGRGMFGIVDAFEKRYPDGRKQLVAVKRSDDKNIDFLIEALFQWTLHNEMKVYGLEFCIPEVYDIFRLKLTNDIWFTMEAFQPYLLSKWCVIHLRENTQKTFSLLLLQIALVLEVFENKLRIDHRDLKVNNILVVNEEKSFTFKWKENEYTLIFPFRIVFVDFGFACIEQLLDIREGNGDPPPLKACPKEGRDIFQVLASIWSIEILRGFLEACWGGWIRERLSLKYSKMAETHKTNNWMYTETDLDNFSAPLCAPVKIIEDCLKVLERNQ